MSKAQDIISSADCGAVMRWEYKIEYVQYVDEKYLNSMGDKGWEVVTIIPQTYHECARVYFKRSIQEQ